MKCCFIQYIVPSDYIPTESYKVRSSRKWQRDVSTCTTIVIKDSMLKVTQKRLNESFIKALNKEMFSHDGIRESFKKELGCELCISGPVFAILPPYHYPVDNSHSVTMQ